MPASFWPLCGCLLARQLFLQHRRKRAARFAAVRLHRYCLAAMLFSLRALLLLFIPFNHQANK